ncbi:MAG: hypothetical protein P4N24_15740 [Acidobacteriota bacterium]|nr:hypothetical protein [Acidobacteriota bacterium]
MEDTVAENTSTGFALAISPGPEDEQRLADEIQQLWAVHIEAKTTVKRTREAMKAIRQRLGERLYEMKLLLVKPGRNGGWSYFLRLQGIAKATADRLVRAHEKPIGPNPNVLSDQVSEPSREEVGLFIDALWPKLEQKLPTPRSAYYFLWWFIGYSGLPYEMRENGILVINPAAASSCTAATPTEAGHTAAAAVATDGDVV